MAELAARGVSLWWVPRPPAFAALRQRIEALAAAHGSPAFDPHVTVLGQIPASPERILATAAELAATLQPVELLLTDYGHEEVWTRWLYRSVARTPPVMEAGARARAHYGVTGGRPYNPHLSLLYGIFEESVATPLLAQSPPPLRLYAEELVVVSTEGPVGDWVELGRFSLS